MQQQKLDAGKNGINPFLKKKIECISLSLDSELHHAAFFGQGNIIDSVHGET